MPKTAVLLFCVYSAAIAGCDSSASKPNPDSSPADSARTDTTSAPDEGPTRDTQAPLDSATADTTSDSANADASAQSDLPVDTLAVDATVDTLPVDATVDTAPSVDSTSDISSDVGCTPQVLLSGTVAPESEGWAAFENIDGSLPVSTDGASVLLDTTAATSAGPSPVLLYSLDVTLTAPFSLGWKMKVVQADAHNYADSGVVFMGAYTTNYGMPQDRYQMIYFETNAIGWADDAGSYTMDTTDAFHSYRLDVDSQGEARVYVDGSLALTRTGFQTAAKIAFGDQTNDPNVDGAFHISDVTLLCP